MNPATLAKLATLSLFGLLSACGGGGGGGSTPPVTTAPTLIAINVTPVNPSVRVGSTQQLTATGSYSDGSTQDLTASVTWTSSAEANVSVSNAGGSSGLATAAAIGSATVTAALGPTTGGTTLTVIDVVSLPETGQATCYSADGSAMACAGTGQDGELKAGVAWPAPRFVVGTGVGTTDQCVTDSLTGLMWTRNANLPAAGQTWQQALDYANNLVLCGFDDWRVPNRKELRSLIDHSSSSVVDTLNTLGFNNVQGVHYWSSSSYAGDAGSAWVINMGYGGVYADVKSNNGYVWPVRAGQ